MTAARTRDDRLAMLRRQMAERDIGLVVAGATGFDMIDYANPVMHLTGLRPIGPALLLVTPTDLILLASPADDAERIAASTPAISWLATDDLAAALRDALPRLKAERGIGLIDVGRLPRAVVAAVTATVGEGEEIGAAFYAATGPKTGDEIASARSAVAAAEAGYRHLLEIVRPGMRECDLAVETNLFMRGLGANDSFLLLTSGRDKKAIMAPSERRIEAGDLILVELSPAVDGQFVQICRTICVGAPHPVVREKYGLLVEAMLAGCAAVRSGVAMGAVCAAVNRVLADAGYAQYANPPFIRRRGHGLGSGSVVPGDVAVDNATVLEEGMLFMVHPNQFLPETGYMMCGEPVLVTADGGAILSRDIAALGTAG